MDEARLRAGLGADHGTVVAARLQHAGRGRNARPWSSPAGNLHATLLLRPGVAPRRAPELGFTVAVAVAAAVDAVAGPGTALKWPNDVLRCGAKLAGILLERLDDGAVLAGIGLNVRHAPPDMPYPVTSLAAEGLDLTPETVLDAILLEFDSVWTLWREHGLAAILARWRERGPALATPLRVRLPSATVSGGFAGLAPDGSLLLDTPTGQRTLVAGEVLLPE